MHACGIRVRAPKLLHVSIHGNVMTTQADTSSDREQGGDASAVIFEA